MPASGDTIRYSLVDVTTELDYSSTGANQVWDFSSLEPFRQDVANYKRASEINPAYLFFFGSTAFGLEIFDSLSLGSVTLEDFNAFYKTTSAAFVAEGAGLSYQGIPIPAFYSDEDEIYQFPLTYSDRDSSTYRVSFRLSDSLQYVQSGYRINLVDGWGSITTPYGTFNSLRIKSTLYRTDSLIILGFSIPVRSVQESYIWLSDEEKIPILQIDGTIVSNTLVVTNIRYRDSYDACTNQVPDVGFTSDLNVVAVDDTVTFQNLTPCGNSVYQWNITPTTGFSFVDGTSFLSANPRVQFTSAGMYSVTLKASNLVGTDSLVRLDYITVNVVTSNDAVGQNPTEVYLHVYPNPVSEDVQICVLGTSVPGGAKQSKIRILSQAGTELASLTPQNGTCTFNFRGYPPGIYWVVYETSRFRIVKK